MVAEIVPVEPIQLFHEILQIILRYVSGRELPSLLALSSREIRFPASPPPPRCPPFCGRSVIAWAVHCVLGGAGSTFIVYLENLRIRSWSII